MARKSTVVYLYTEKKIRLFEQGVRFLERVNISDFRSLKGYDAGANRPEIQNSVKKYIYQFRSNEMYVCNY